MHGRNVHAMKAWVIWRNEESFAPAGHLTMIPWLSIPLSSPCNNYIVLAHTEKVRKIKKVWWYTWEKQATLAWCYLKIRTGDGLLCTWWWTLRLHSRQGNFFEQLSCFWPLNKVSALWSKSFDSVKVWFCVVNRPFQKHGRRILATHDLPFTVRVKDATKYHWV